MRTRLLPFGLALWVGCLLVRPAVGQTTYAAPAVSLEEVPAPYRDRCRHLLEKPTYRHVGQGETFLARAASYVWLLDNPDKAVALWRQIGAQVAQVDRRGDHSFGWRDDNGSDLRWDTLVRTGTRRVWYAEGRVKPALLVPGATVRALIVLHHHLEPGQEADGRDRIRHQVEFVLQTDSALLALASRVMGATAPRLAEQFTSQVQMFFGGMAWYLDTDPDRAGGLLQRVNGQ